MVSMPSMEMFDAQSSDYKEEILPSNITKRISLEALSSFGWHKYIGIKGMAISIDTFGASGRELKSLKDLVSLKKTLEEKSKNFNKI